MKKLLKACCLLGLLASCNSGQQAENADSLKQQQQAIVQEIREPLEQAKGVEQMLQDKAQEQMQKADGL